MKTRYIYIICLCFLLIGNSACAQDKNDMLTPDAVADVIKKHPEMEIIDVRTPEEYAAGHLANSKNYNYKAVNFENQIASLDKSKPVIVYCLSGGRSAKAAQKMRAKGFSKVYEMQGGIVKWRSENLPEEAVGVDLGMTMAEFEHMLISDKLVLVDFYAEWCLPCKKMEPYLKEISEDMSGSVKVVRIDADKNRNLCKALKVDALPVLQVYKNKELIWNHSGFIEKDDVLKQLQ